MRTGRGARSAPGEAGAEGIDLRTSIGPVELANPVMTAAGTSGHGAELQAYFDLSELGAVVVKSLASFAWPGNPGPRVVPVPGGMLNSVGLQGPGVEAWAAEELPALERTGARVVASIWGRRSEDFADAAAALATALGDNSCVVALEVNVSCPNLEDRSKMFAHSPAATAEAVEASRRGALPVVAKLSPNTPDLLEVASAALDAGAIGLTLVNTVLGLAIDTESRKPALGGVGGGLSGPALHSVALRAVYECRSAFPDTAIVGVGGVSDGAGALRLLMAGANAVQVGTATLADPRAAINVLGDLRRQLAVHGAKSAGEVIGAAQR